MFQWLIEFMKGMIVGAIIFAVVYLIIRGLL